MPKEIKMPDIKEEVKKKYEDKVHKAFQAIQDEGGMTNANVLELQKLLARYPEYENLELGGLYDDPTIEAVKSFYSKHYWTEDRLLQESKDRYGEKYIMASEMESMRKELEENNKNQNMKEAFPDTAANSLA